MYYGWSTLKKLIYLVRQIAKKVIGVLTYVEGTYPPIRLESAVKSNLVMLKQFGNCAQESTPTPSAPAPIMCNNGEIKFGALGANLLDPSPSNIRLEYYINKADGLEKPSPPNFMFEGYMPVEAGKTYVAYGRAKSGNDLSDYNRVAWYDSNKEWLSGADYTQNRIAIVTAPANAAYARFSCNPSGTTTQTVTQEYIDSFNWTFAEGTAEITPFVPFVGGIYIDGTPEQIYVGGKNLNAGEITHQGYDSNGNIITSNNLAGTLTKIPVRFDKTTEIGTGVFQPNLFISWDGITNGRTAYVYVWKKDGTFFRDGGVTNGAGVVVNKNAEYISVAVYDPRTDGVEITEDAWIQVEYSSSNAATEYQPYTGGTYVNAVDLLGIPNVVAGQDSHNIITGEVDRNVGIKVFDGSESVSASGAGWAIAIADKIKSKVAMFCTHYPYSSATMANAPDKSIISFASQNIGIKDSSLTSASAVKSWLAEQYAAGTPVIVIYQLSDKQISHVDPQPITLPEGEDVVYWAAPVNGKRMTAQYYRLSTNAVGSAIVGTATAG